MAKRKAKELGDALAKEEPRRSSRRISKIASKEPEVEAEDDKPRQPRKKTTKATTKSVEQINGTDDSAAGKPVGRLHFLETHQNPTDLRSRVILLLLTSISSVLEITYNLLTRSLGVSGSF